ncbi:MAG: acetyl-CoA carboxylase biotin carboxylase subunit [Desulfomonilaceae bacterium]|nr:acetyl-CoA carboxylase biotin carboxylase subunit [Desulfomonilaceae bacterium]
MFHKILIANRGEIALRIIRTCRRMGIHTVAVHSEADFRSRHVREADEACVIGEAPAAKSYLDKDKIIETALAHGCAAIHPGYGFLSENAEFVRMVEDAGLVFIGPPAEATALLGDKTAAKALAVRAGVPVVPGHHEPIGDSDDVQAIAHRVGFPLLLKPAGGGGGRGMRIVSSPDDLLCALSECRDETRKGFADDRIFMERYVSRPRHIEIQIMADRHGNIVHMGERECSIQRRYQKVIEETPSPAVHGDLRLEMGRVACALAREAGYVGAGTVEFVLDAEKKFYFLEMNTRLQVEHPVTELVTGLDLVEMQIRVADGEPLGVEQKDIVLNGWAIEARICAEDPSRDFFPTTGMITRYAMPMGNNVRVDSGVEAGSVISIYYDSLLAKVAAWGETRDKARKTLIRALNGYHLEGLVTNVDFANAVLDHPAFARGDLSTDFIDDHFVDGTSILPPDPEKIRHMIMAAVLVYHVRQRVVRESLKMMAPHVGGTPVRPKSHQYVVQVDSEVFEVHLEGDRLTKMWNIMVNNHSYEVVTPDFEFYRRRLKLQIDGSYRMFRLNYREKHIQAAYCGIIRTFEIYSPREWSLAHYMPRRKTAVVENVLRCPMPGLVVAVNVAEGTLVRRGQELLRIESMKMESGIGSPGDLLVEKVLVQPGQAVETDEVLVVFGT